jgi:hypothetical protein
MATPTTGTNDDNNDNEAMKAPNTETTHPHCCEQLLAGWTAGAASNNNTGKK